MIVGFPGETEEEFEESRAFVEKVNFYETHIFKYSRREGTKAAVMENQVPEQIKTKRSNVLLELDEKKRKEYEEKFIGKTVEVLMEEEIEKDGKIYQTGHTKEYINSTQFFRVEPAPQIQAKDILEIVYQALREKGYNPVNQIVGYIMSGDPTYITSHNGARSLIMKMERDELVEEMLKTYIEHHSWE